MYQLAWLDNDRAASSTKKTTKGVPQENGDDVAVLRRRKLLIGVRDGATGRRIYAIVTGRGFFDILRRIGTIESLFYDGFIDIARDHAQEILVGVQDFDEAFIKSIIFFQIKRVVYFGMQDPLGVKYLLFVGVREKN